MMILLLFGVFYTDTRFKHQFLLWFLSSVPWDAAVQHQTPRLCGVGRHVRPVPLPQRPADQPHPDQPLFLHAELLTPTQQPHHHRLVLRLARHGLAMLNESVQLQLRARWVSDKMKIMCYVGSRGFVMSSLKLEDFFVNRRKFWWLFRLWWGRDGLGGGLSKLRLIINVKSSLAVVHTYKGWILWSTFVVKILYFIQQLLPSKWLQTFSPWWMKSIIW